MEVQLKQTEQQLSKQITEECQAVQLRSGKILKTSLQDSRKPRNEQTTQIILAFKHQKMGGKLALNA